jgi:4,5-dihydroxyphthalate decarboxylase
MSRLRLTLAISEYDHVRDLLSGAVPVNGIDLIPLLYETEEIFYRFSRHREWDISEMSMGKYVSLIASGDRSLTAIPVFPSRFFRQSACYVRLDGPVQRPEDLRGRRIGVPEWTQTAGIYARAWLTHQVGLPLQDIAWVRGGINEPGREESFSLNLPSGVNLQVETEQSLNEMLLNGDLDAIITAHPPRAYKSPGAGIGHLVRDIRQVEQDYFRDTGIFPIMHVMAIKRAVFEEHPWVAMNLLDAFEAAKQRSMDRMSTLAASRTPIPWAYEAVREARELFGEDWLPYGIEANRTTLEAFLKFCYEQGTAEVLVSVDDLFPAQVSGRFKV